MLCCVGMMNAAELKIGKADGPIKIDGKFDEASWSKAETAKDFSLLSSQNPRGEKPDVQTSFRVMADAENLYFAITCEEPQMKMLKDALRGKPSNPWSNDLVEIFLSPLGTPDEYYQFAITAGGAVWQQFYAERGNIRPDPYEPEIEVASLRGERWWTLEIRFPLHAFYMTDKSHWNNKWLCNVSRLRHAKYQNSSWGRLQTSLHETASFNTLTNAPEKPAAFDLRICSAAFQPKEALSGTLETEILLQEAPEGKYTLTCGKASAGKVLKKGVNHIPLFPVVFAESGKNKVILKLLNTEGKTVAERTYPVSVENIPLKVTFSSPGFGNNFYPGERSDRLVGSVIVNLPVSVVAAKLNGKSYELSVRAGKAEFDLPLEGDEGIFEVNAGKNAVTTVIRKIRGPAAWIRDGKILIDGKPTVLLGWYGGGGWVCSKAFLEKYPTPADKHPYNFSSWIQMDPRRLLGNQIGEEEMVFDREPSKKVYEAVRKNIEKEKNSPLRVYYLSDEPECTGYSPVYLRYLYEYIRKLDPTRLVMIITRSPELYIDCADILNPHPYVNPVIADDGRRSLRVPIANVRAVCRKVAEANRRDKALMLTPQTFSYAMTNIYADFTTFDETNASVWTSICQGGQGITPYIYYDHASRPGLNLGCDFIYQSLERLAPMISAMENKLEIVVSDPENIDSRLIRANGKILLILVNVSQEKRQVSVSSEALKMSKELFCFREDKMYPVSKGSMSVELAPYQVMLLTSEKMDQGLESLEQMRKQIEMAERSRRNRGNILFGQGRKIELSHSPSKPYDLQNTMEQQDKLFDGIIDVSAWMPRNVDGALWYELAFAQDIPRFSKARIFGNDLKGVVFKIWKFGEWIIPPSVRSEQKYSVEFDFGKTLSTVKIRLEFPESAKKSVEMYEFELLK